MFLLKLAPPTITGTRSKMASGKSAGELFSDILCLLISGSVGLYSLLVQLLVSVAKAAL